MIHRFAVGTMQATILSDGPLLLPAASDIFDGLPPAAGQSATRTTIEQNCLLLEIGGRKILFDNGLGSQKLYGPDSGRLPASLAEAGIAPTDIDALVLTHGHCDHCWGTMADDGTPQFPNATIYMAEAELAYWESDPPAERDEPSLAGVARHLLPLRDRIVFVRDGATFLPGVQAWLTPGHTPGHMAFLFEGNWCLTGDVAFHDPLSFAFPDARSAFDTDPLQGVETRRRVLARLADAETTIVGYHQPWPGLGRIVRHGGSFRFLAGA